MPSWTRAPPESLMKTNGEPVLRVACIIADDLVGVDLAGGATGDGEVLAGDVHQAGRSTVPSPVTTPSAGRSASAMPK